MTQDCVVTLTADVRCVSVARRSLADDGGDERLGHTPIEWKTIGAQFHAQQFSRRFRPGGCQRARPESRQGGALRERRLDTKFGPQPQRAVIDVPALGDEVGVEMPVVSKVNVPVVG